MHMHDGVALRGRLEDRRVIRRKPHDEPPSDTAEEWAELAPEMQKARRLRTGPELQVRWWRGQDLNLRPSGYEPAQCRGFSCRLLR